ncbi:glycosyl hydrolase family 88-domain-containing protein [Melampsora americana]|nr:glycosyl hydrolase family 88-domain-containing protein [Melampsora americana]
MFSFLYIYVFLSIMYRIEAAKEPDYQPSINLAYEVLGRISNHSWEYGTYSEVMLQLKGNSELSVFAPKASLPLPTTPNTKLWQPEPLFKLVDSLLAKRAKNATTIIEADGAAGDPASLGVPLLVLDNASKRANKKPKYDYLKIAQQQYDHLIKVVPKDKNGAISQRESEVQYWSDYVHMVPPFLAYLGAINSDYAILENSYLQCKYYRDVLLDAKSGTWRHILRGSFEDTGIWSTGNGWAAAGMMRVRQTMEAVSNKELSGKLTKMKTDLESWISEIIVGSFKFQSTKSNLLPNYFDKKPAETFEEVSGTALITATAYRLAILNKKFNTILPMQKVEAARKTILEKHLDPKTGSVSTVVDPLNWNSKAPFDGSPGKQSPEGQAFVILMHTAWKVYTSSNSALNSTSGSAYSKRSIIQL